MIHSLRTSLSWSHCSDYARGGKESDRFSDRDAAYSCSVPAAAALAPQGFFHGGEQGSGALGVAGAEGDSLRDSGEPGAFVGGQAVDLVVHEQAGVLARSRSLRMRSTATMCASRSASAASTTCRSKSASCIPLGWRERPAPDPWQVADEAHGVSQDQLALARETQPPRGGVERGEELVLDQHSLPVRC